MKPDKARKLLTNIRFIEKWSVRLFWTGVIIVSTTVLLGCPAYTCYNFFRNSLVPKGSFLVEVSLFITFIECVIMMLLLPVCIIDGHEWYKSWKYKLEIEANYRK